MISPELTARSSDRSQIFNIISGLSNLGLSPILQRPGMDQKVSNLRNGDRLYSFSDGKVGVGVIVRPSRGIIAVEKFPSLWIGAEPIFESGKEIMLYSDTPSIEDSAFLPQLKPWLQAKELQRSTVLLSQYGYAVTQDSLTSTISIAHGSTAEEAPNEIIISVQHRDENLSHLNVMIPPRSFTVSSERVKLNTYIHRVSL